MGEQKIYPHPKKKMKEDTPMANREEHGGCKCPYVLRV